MSDVKSEPTPQEANQVKKRQEDEAGNHLSETATVNARNGTVSNNDRNNSQAEDSSSKPRASR